MLQVQAQPTNPVYNMPLANLPVRMERSVPTFDDTQPKELKRYFADLQVLLDHYNIMDQQDCKQAALKYLKIWTENL
jgi:hypothetical protein